MLEPEQDTDRMSVTATSARTYAQHQPSWFVRLLDNKTFLIVVCLTPAIGLLTVFLTYPLGLGVWLAFTDTTMMSPTEA